MMNRFSPYIVIALLIAAILLLTLQFCPRKPVEVSVRKDQEKTKLSNGLELEELDGDLRPKTNSLAGLDRFAFEFSREICKQEQIALSAVVDTSGLKPGEAVLVDSESKLTPSQAIQWLKKTANSKCSSFRKNNAMVFFNNLSIDKNNYKSAYSDYEQMLAEHRGLTPYKLIRESLDALSRANKAESKLLKDAIVFSVASSIKDASSDVDIMGAMYALRDVREGGIIVHPTKDEIDKLLDEYKLISEEHIVKSRQINKKYFPPGTDFSNITSEQIVNMLGEEGVKADLELRRREYEVVRKYAEKLDEMMKRNF